MGTVIQAEMASGCSRPCPYEPHFHVTSEKHRYPSPFSSSLTLLLGWYQEGHATLKVLALPPLVRVKIKAETGYYLTWVFQENS